VSGPDNASIAKMKKLHEHELREGLEDKLLHIRQGKLQKVLLMKSNFDIGRKARDGLQKDN